MIRRTYNWVVYKLKRFWQKTLIVLGITTLVAVAATTGGTITEGDVLQLIVARQAIEVRQTGKYFRTTDKDFEQLGLNLSKFPYEIVIHEYQVPGGEVGYQVIITKEFDALASNSIDTVKVKKSKSVGYGPKAVDRTWDWR